MGVSISATNSKYSFDCSYGGFFNLRKNVALAFDEEFGRHYAKLLQCHSNDDYDLFDEKANQILADERFKEEDNDILDFLLASDTSGKISYKTCKKIYELIKDIDYGNKIFTYGAYSDGKDYEHLKEFLKECYSCRKNMIWR